MEQSQGGTGNFWIDNGLVVLERLLSGGDLPADVNRLLRQLAEQVYRETGKTAEYWDEQSQKVRTYNKRNWQEPVGLFVSVVDSPPKKRVGGKELYTRPPDAASALRINPKGNAECDLCGAQGPVENARQYLFPFVVDPGKFGNFYSAAKRGVKVCARCAVAGFAAFQSVLWRRHGDTYHLFVFHTDLPRLHSLHNSLIAPMRLAGAKGGNFEAPFSGEYPYESLFALLLSLFKTLRARESTGEVDPLLAELTGARPAAGNPIVVYAISGEGGKGFSMRALVVFDRFHQFYRLYSQWLGVFHKSNDPHKVVSQVFRQFQHRRQKKTETLWREHVCSAILRQTDPAPAVEAFLRRACRL